MKANSTYLVVVGQCTSPQLRTLCQTERVFDNIHEPEFGSSTGKGIWVKDVIIQYSVTNMDLLSSGGSKTKIFVVVIVVKILYIPWLIELQTSNIMH